MTNATAAAIDRQLRAARHERAAGIPLFANRRASQRPGERSRGPAAGEGGEVSVRFSCEKCIVCGKPMEIVNHLYDHHCDQRLLNRKDGDAKRDPAPPISQSYAARLSQGFRLLNSY